MYIYLSAHALTSADNLSTFLKTVTLLNVYIHFLMLYMELRYFDKLFWYQIVVSPYLKINVRFNLFFKKYIALYILHHIHIDLSIYLSIVLFGPVKPELGVIPSGQENHSGAEHLNFPGGELNVIFLQSNISLRKKPKTG